jgi:hypothetical protein
MRAMPRLSVRLLIRLGGLLFCVGSVGAAGAGCTEAVDNVQSDINCRAYCNKKAACRDTSPSASETSTCVRSCRDSIENNCGNEHQAAANEAIAECVDRSCGEFAGCMVFAAAPECFGFVD